MVLRLVFLLYAEERDMLPQDETFLGAYSVSGLYERLREDAALHPDTMDQRYGAYAQLLALWRMVHDGARGAQMSLSPRHGDLFDPERYPFLEGSREQCRHWRARWAHASIRPSSATAQSTACWRSSSCWTPSASPTGRWTWSTSARFTRR